MTTGVQGAASPQMPRSAMPAAAAAAALTGAGGRPQSQGVPSVATVQAVVAKPSQDELSKAVSDINKSVQFLSNGLVFSIDEDSQRQIAKVIDSHTNEVIRQFPTDQALQLAKVLDQVLGKLVNEKA